MWKTPRWGRFFDGKMEWGGDAFAGGDTKWKVMEMLLPRDDTKWKVMEMLLPRDDTKWKVME